MTFLEQAIDKGYATISGKGTKQRITYAAVKVTRSGKPWTPTQVKRLIADYQGSFTKSNNKVSVATRQFIEAMG